MACRAAPRSLRSRPPDSDGSSRQPAAVPRRSGSGRLLSSPGRGRRIETGRATARRVPETGPRPRSTTSISAARACVRAGRTSPARRFREVRPTGDRPGSIPGSGLPLRRAPTAARVRWATEAGRRAGCSHSTIGTRAGAVEPFVSPVARAWAAARTRTWRWTHADREEWEYGSVAYPVTVLVLTPSVGGHYFGELLAGLVREVARAGAASCSSRRRKPTT